MIVIPVVSSSTNQLSSGDNLALPAFQSPLLRSSYAAVDQAFISLDWPICNCSWQALPCWLKTRSICMSLSDKIIRVKAHLQALTCPVWEHLCPLLKFRSCIRGCWCCMGAAAIKYQLILTTSTGSLARFHTRHNHSVVFKGYEARAVSAVVSVRWQWMNQTVSWDHTGTRYQQQWWWLLESDRYRLRSKKLRLSVDVKLVRIDVEVPVSDVVVWVPISDGGVMGRTYGYSDG